MSKELNTEELLQPPHSTASGTAPGGHSTANQAGDASEHSPISQFAENENEESRSNLSAFKVLTGDILSVDFIRRQIGLIILCLVFVIIYITNRYSAEQEIIEIEQLKIELQEIKYRALTRSSELTERSRQSHIEEQLRINGDSTLRMPLQPPYVILKSYEP